jgi:hypothetical protein
MELPDLASLRALFASAAVGAAVAVPLACAQGSGIPDVGPTGVGGAGSSAHTGSSSGSTGGTGGAPHTSSASSSASSASSGKTTSSSASSSSGLGPCDIPGPASNPNCQTCAMCSQMGGCATEVNNCSVDCDCLNIFGCIQSMMCTTQACVDGCVALYPPGQANYNALIHCESCECINACGVKGVTCP